MPVTKTASCHVTSRRHEKCPWAHRCYTGVSKKNIFVDPTLVEASRNAGSGMEAKCSETKKRTDMADTLLQAICFVWWHPSTSAPKCAFGFHLFEGKSISDCHPTTSHLKKYTGNQDWARQLELSVGVAVAFLWNDGMEPEWRTAPSSCQDVHQTLHLWIDLEHALSPHACSKCTTAELEWKKRCQVWLETWRWFSNLVCVATLYIQILTARREVCHERIETMLWNEADLGQAVQILSWKANITPIRKDFLHLSCLWTHQPKLNNPKLKPLDNANERPSKNGCQNDRSPCSPWLALMGASTCS